MEAEWEKWKGKWKREERQEQRNRQRKSEGKRTRKKVGGNQERGGRKDRRREWREHG